MKDQPRQRKYRSSVNSLIGQDEHHELFILKEKLCAVVPRKVSQDLLEACEEVLNKVVEEERSIQRASLCQALNLCSHAIILRQSCGDDLSLEYLGHITRLRNLICEICTQRTVEIEEKGRTVTVWGRDFREGTRIFYRAKARVYLVVLSYDGSTGEEKHSLLAEALFLSNLITEQGVRDFYQMHMRPAVFIGMDNIPDHSFAYFVCPGDIERSQLNDDKNDP